MENYICINGNKTVLTEAQVKNLGFSFDQSIDKISQIVRSGKARDHFKLHDILSLGGHEMEIIGFDHDKDIGGKSAHTITLMAKTLLDNKRMNGGACERGWIDTELREWLNSSFLDQMPDELVQHICTVEKITHNYKGEAFKTSDSLFCPSESELFGSAIYADCEDGTRYEAFATSEDRQRFDTDGDADWYWTRSANSGYSGNFAYVGNNGGAGYYAASGAGIRTPLCFCFA